MKFILIGLLLPTVCLADAKRESRIGYLKGNNAGDVYFVKSPVAAEVGMPVFFETKDENSKACKVTKVTPQVDCPLQTISFIPGTKNHKLSMLNARVENATSPWHEAEASARLLKAPKK